MSVIKEVTNSFLMDKTVPQESDRKRHQRIPMGGTIGILGGGQLGRMAAMAAAELGYVVHIYSPDPDSPAAEVSQFQTHAAFDDRTALTAFANSVDVITCEMEHVPAETLKWADAITPVHPSVSVFEKCQNRIAEKTFLNEIGIDTAKWYAVESLDQVESIYQNKMDSGILKIAYAGYDGKGQARLEPGLSRKDLESKWASIFGDKDIRGTAILEAIVPFERELSVIVARANNGDLSVYDVVENIHKDHILSVTHAPASVSKDILKSAQNIAIKIAEALQVQGLLAVELFLTRDGNVLVNELAPRPHNSGHWTIDACSTSQFEQLIRAICGLPLGSSKRWANAEMVNLIGDEVIDSSRFLDMENSKLHLYGKKEVRPGRKMGHATIVKPLTD
jgi:5-(carboxyamino)imidazole ribonucleotide synthase